jgi:Ser/Thr protein kinase RdoA (MazF antagonist)
MSAAALRPPAAPEPIPTDEVGLLRLIAATPAVDRYALCERLEVLHGEVCDRLRAELSAALGAALAGLAEAERLVSILRSARVYDIEYDTHAGADLLHLIAEARRGVRVATTVQKSIP